MVKGGCLDTPHGLLRFRHLPFAIPEAGFPQIHALREGGGFDLDGKSRYPATHGLQRSARHRRIPDLTLAPENLSVSGLV
jgi:hypothetical protein